MSKLSTKHGLSKPSMGRRSARKEITPEQLMDAKTELKRLVQQNITPLTEEPEFTTCDDTLTRFLKARNYNIQEAFKQLSTATDWRRNYRPLSVRCPWCSDIPGYHGMRQIGFDPHGRPIMYACFAQCQTMKNTADDIIVHTVYLIENAKKCCSDPGVAMIFIIDCTGLTLGCCNPKIGKKFIQTFSDCYPERLHRFILVHQNPFFYGVWKAIRVFIDPITVKKVKLIKKEQIENNFNELFDTQTSKWLLDELQLNKTIINDSNQLKFWEFNNSTNHSTSHDPRGTPDYVKRFIVPLENVVENSSTKLLNITNLNPSTHLPHPNIIDYMNGKLKNVKVIAMHSHNKSKPKKEDLEEYGINSTECTEDLSEDDDVENEEGEEN